MVLTDAAAGPATLGQPRSRARRRLLAVVPPALAGALLVLVVVPQAAHTPLWLDEAFSAALAVTSWHEFARVVTHGEINMSSYYLLVRAAAAVSHHAWVLRLPSLAAALAMLGYLHRLALRLMPPVAAAATLLFVAVNPLTIQYAMQARSYTLAMLCATAAGLHLLQGLRGGRRSWVGWAVWSVVGVFAHAYLLFVLAVHGVVALVARRRVVWRWALPAAGAVAAACGGFLWLITAGHSTQNDWIAHLTWSRFLAVVATLPGLPWHHLGGPALVVTLAGLGGLAARAARHRYPVEPVLLPGGWLLAPLLLATAVTVWHQPLLSPRYLLVSLPAAALLLGALAGSAPRLLRWPRPPWAPGLPVRLLAAGAVLAAVLPSTATELTYGIGVERADRAVALLARDARPGDALVTLPQYYRVLVDWYADRGPLARFHGLTAVIPPVPLGRYPAYLGTAWPAARPPAPGEFTRVWVIRRGIGHSVADVHVIPRLYGSVLDWLCQGRRLSGEWFFPGVLVSLYAPGPGRAGCPAGPATAGRGAAGAA